MENLEEIWSGHRRRCNCHCQTLLWNLSNKGVSWRTGHSWDEWQEVSAGASGILSSDQYIYLFTCSIQIYGKNIKMPFLCCSFFPTFFSFLILTLRRKTLHMFQDEIKSTLCSRGFSNLPRKVLASTSLQSLVISCTELCMVRICLNSACVFTCFIQAQDGEFLERKGHVKYISQSLILSTASRTK